jgi:hypothetical protein
LRRHGIRVVVGGALNVDDARQIRFVVVEQTRTAMTTEVPPTIGRGYIHFRLTLRHSQGLRGVHRPAHHWRAGVPPTIAAMAQRMGERCARHFVTNRAAMTTACNAHLVSPH